MSHFKAQIKSECDHDIHLGCYHEKPDGTIVFTIGTDGKTFVSYFFQKDNRFEYGNVSIKKYKKFKIREDLNDFPNSIDPVLPYDFDLNYDIKRYSELKFILTHPETCDSPISKVREMMRHYGIKVKDVMKIKKRKSQ